MGSYEAPVTATVAGTYPVWTGASPYELGKDRPFRGCALRYLECTLHMLDAGASVAPRQVPWAERGN